MFKEIYKLSFRHFSKQSLAWKKNVWCRNVVKILIWLLNANGDSESINSSTSLTWIIFISFLTLILSETSLLLTCEAILSVHLFYFKRQKVLSGWLLFESLLSSLRHMELKMQQIWFLKILMEMLSYNLCVSKYILQDFHLWNYLFPLLTDQAVKYGEPKHRL